MPNKYPAAIPMPNCFKRASKISEPCGICEAEIIEIILIVRKIAIGSFEPDSSSISGARLFFSEIFLARNIANTAAASVEETIAPKSSASPQENPSKNLATGASASAVKITPSVASASPRPKIGFIALKSVSSPPA